LYSNFISPRTLYHANADDIKVIKKLKDVFKADNLVVEQYFTPSKDGTLIPYFMVHKKDMILDGSNPTLIYAYGGFNVSQQPDYSYTIGLGWLEQGGVYVLANIRGGGEYGPSWHEAGMKEKKQNSYDDFYAVSEDLIKKKVTSPKNLGAFGWSNGGLLAGVIFTQRPELFNAVVIGAPLLDMKRYTKLLAGASWIGENGDPDIPEEWEYIKKYSPYHNIHADKEYPEVFFVTSTKDDRVHPGHARKMAAKMISMGHPLLYQETIEGGHGAASTNEQQANVSASMYTYLNMKLNKSH
jgi:prolyl oligopeptidase